MSMLENVPPVNGRRPAPGSSTSQQRAPGWLLIALGSGFGFLSGPFLSAVANHGRPVAGSLLATPVLLSIAAVFGWMADVLDGEPLRSTLVRVAAVLIGGGVLFMLPHSLALPAEGDFWWRTDAERWAVYSVPYPFVAWLVFSRSRRRWAALATCAAVAGCLASAWPKLLVGARAQTAVLMHDEIDVPAASLYAVGIPGARPTDGYFADDGTVSVTYTLDGYTHPAATTDAGYDIGLTVFPATDSSPCPDLSQILLNALPDGGGAGTADDEACRRLPDGRWRYAHEYDVNHVTQVERVGGYFIVLTANTHTTGLVEDLPVVFASLHHPTTREFVAIGLSDAFPSPLE